ncbi:hypothetical protein ACP70R_033648 [Stipagrostis hirtigluma subsp. patula]
MGRSPEAGAACPECLERRVLHGLAGSGLSFVHGLPDSPLPFASSAVVQIASDGAEENGGRQNTSGYFVLVGLHGGKVFSGSTKCDNSLLENGIHLDTQGEGEQGIYSDDTRCAVPEDSSSGKVCSEDHESTSGFCEESPILSTITKLTPVCYLGIGHTSEIRELITNYLNLSTEESVITSLNLLSENKIGGSAGLDFLSYVGFSAFDDLNPCGCVRHPNILPVLGVLETSNCCYIWGFADPDCSPNSWCSMDDCSSRDIYTGFKLKSSLDWRSHFKQWWKGELSNYEYLLVLNKLAGRRWGDPAFHTVMPWVIDFTVKPDESSDNGWRDLTKSKWRLAQGDEQLDFTYSSSDVPHHVSDECLSELAVCSYKARRLPKAILSASVEAKNVMLPPSDPSRPKSIGRRQLFTGPHPKRLVSTPHAIYHNKVESCGRCRSERRNASTDVMLNGCGPPNMISEMDCFEEFEQATLFAELEYHLNPIYDYSDTSACCSSSKRPKSQIAEWTRRPSAKHLFESPYFPPSVRSAYMFLSPLQVLCKPRDRLKYVAKLASEGAVKAMGEFAAEMCAPYCLALVSSSFSDVDTESALPLLKEFLKCLNIQATKGLVLQIIQKILQAPEYSHLKVAVLQDSFVRELWMKLGKRTYIEKVHPLLITNLYNSPNKITASAASTVLVGSSEELGIPITVHQTVLPLIHCFGKGLSADGIDTLVRIGGVLGESFIVKQILPLLKNVITSWMESSKISKPEPQHSWNSSALIDSLSALEGVVCVLPVQTVVRELLQDQVCLHIKVLMQVHLDLRVTQVAASTFGHLCQRIGPENTCTYVLPQLKELFAELAFSHESSGLIRPSKGLKIADGNKIEPIKMESRSDLVLLLYPFLASLVGRDKLCECCSTWFLLEQTLNRMYNWKWETFGDCSKSAENMKGQRFQPDSYTSSEFVPTKLLFNGVGWSVPQSEIAKNGWNAAACKQGSKLECGTSSDVSSASSSGNQPWFWFPSPDSSWEAPDFLGRGGGVKDELPWKIKASILYSARAHPGALRSLAVHDDEFTIFTGGVGPGFKGSIQKWELPNMNCTSGYYGHEEIVNSISILSITGRVASCDGTIHIWNGQTGKLIATHAESSISFPLQTLSTEQTNMLNQDALSGGILSNVFRGSLYTTMHYMESEGKLVAGMGNGSIRFIDISRDQKLHLWKSDSAEISFSSLVSAICSCGSDKLMKGSSAASSSWIAAGLSSGYCRLLDERSGSIIAAWRAHDGHITKLAAPDDHLIVSSSLDRTLRVWDLRGNLATQSNIFRSHSEGISSFSVWGQDVVSISRNKIALTSLSRPASEIGHEQLVLQNLYSADRGVKHKNLSVLSTIAVLPLSRLFLVGTEDGFLKICH